MDELKQIITHKLKIMAQYNSMNVEDMSSQLLIKEKRKQGSRQVLQSRLLQSLSTRRIQAPYRTQQFYHDSIYMMKIYDSQFVYSIQQNISMLENIMKLYGTFFQKQDCQRRTEQIYHLFQKRLCQKNMLISTLFGWFAQWTKKTYQAFLKNTLIQINTRKQTRSQQKRKIQNKTKIQNQIKNHQQTIKSIQKQISYNRDSSLTVKKSQLLDYNLRSIQIENNKQKIKSKNKNKLGKQKSLNLIKPTQEQLIICGTHSIHGNPEDSGKKTSIQRKQHVYLVNKYMLFSAYYQQMYQYYKSYSSILTDIDISFPRSLKKVDRRVQLKSKFLEIAKSIVREQTYIKKSIDNYSKQYLSKFPRKQIKSSKRKSKQKSRILQHEKQRQQNDGQEQEKNLSIFLENSKLNFNQKLNYRENSLEKQNQIKKKPELQKKTLEIELPQIKSNSRLAIHSKPNRIIIVQSGRKNQKYTASRRHSRDISQLRLSTQLVKQINDLNYVFKKKQYVSKTYNSPGKKSIEYQKQKNKRYDIGEISEYIQNNQGDNEINPDGGVFYLPSLPKN